MKHFRGLESPIQLDWKGLVANIRRQGTPDRVYHMELYHDDEVCDALVERFGLAEGLRKDDPWFKWKKTIAVQRFLGMDCLGTGNSVANYIPLDNYLAMVAEGRRYGG